MLSWKTPREGITMDSQADRGPERLIVQCELTSVMLHWVVDTVQRERALVPRRKDRNRHSYTVWLRQRADTSGSLQLSRGLCRDHSMNALIFCHRRLNPQHLFIYLSWNEVQNKPWSHNKETKARVLCKWLLPGYSTGAVRFDFWQSLSQKVFDRQERAEDGQAQFDGTYLYKHSSGDGFELISERYRGTNFTKQCSSYERRHLNFQCYIYQHF